MAKGCERGLMVSMTMGLYVCNAFGAEAGYRARYIFVSISVFNAIPRFMAARNTCVMAHVGRREF